MIYEIISKRQKSCHEPVKTPAAIYNLLKRYRNEQQEHFIVITLNGAHIPISMFIATIGLVNKTVVHPREVFSQAIQDKAVSIVICHNHPSGTLSASLEDKEITEKICKAGNILGIRVLDHIIISKNGFLSLRESGYFNEIGHE